MDVCETEPIKNTKEALEVLVRTLNSYGVCPVCNGTHQEESGVCYCGAEMEGHSLYDNHSATEMTKACELCLALSAVKKFQKDKNGT